LPTAAAKITSKFEIEDDVEVRVFGKIASPYLKPYLHNVRFLDILYGNRNEDEGWLR